jgi:hypothetical protein
MTNTNKTNKDTAKQSTVKPVVSKQGSAKTAPTKPTKPTKPVKGSKLSEAKSTRR